MFGGIPVVGSLIVYRCSERRVIVSELLFGVDFSAYLVVFAFHQVKHYVIARAIDKLAKILVRDHAI